MWEMFVKRCTYIWFKRNKQKCNFHYAVMFMMMPQILKFVNDFEDLECFEPQLTEPPNLANW